MRVIRKIKNIRREINKVKAGKKTIGFVPTMGALHEGHLSLIRQARADNDYAIVSIFVNPVQFGPKEDFKKYPRNLPRDAALCRKEGVDIIFYPDIKEMYTGDFKAYVDVQGLSGVLCGLSRPGHFKGVATVVAKLFNIISPDIAYFGRKDAQQAVIIKKMTEDLNFPVKVKVMPIVRQKDGLAMSSRNTYLSKKERKDALVLPESLGLAKDLIYRGIKDPGKVIRGMKQLIQGKGSIRIDYISILDFDTLKPVKKIIDNCLIALAVRIGKTRLIDNAVISKGRFLS
ncbi:MAG: pantoate--beta-alanine ligase [Candidatus Omnitrophota bacterium]